MSTYIVYDNEREGIDRYKYREQISWSGGWEEPITASVALFEGDRGAFLRGVEDCSI